jgi:hypothetical protein
MRYAAGRLTRTNRGRDAVRALLPGVWDGRGLRSGRVFVIYDRGRVGSDSRTGTRQPRSA